MAQKLLFSHVFILLIGASNQSILINEVNSESSPASDIEIVELWNPDPFSQSLDGYTLAFFNGEPNPVVADTTIDLTGHSISGNGYFLVGHAHMSPGPDLIPQETNFVEDGLAAYCVALYNNSYVPTTPTKVNLVDAIIYAISDNYLAYTGSFFPQVMDPQTVIQEDDYRIDGDKSMSRCSLGAVTLSSFAVGVPTPGTMNFCGPITQIPLTTPCDPTLNNDEPVQQLQIFTFKYFKNTSIQGNPLFSFKTRSSTECAAECSKKAACFKKGSDTSNCLLFTLCDETFSPSELWIVGEKM